MPDEIAWWGAGLSTVLGLIKFWEVWRDRSRVDVTYNFRSARELGNDIRIRNLSNRPIIIEYYEVLSCTGRWPRRKFTDLLVTDYEAGDHTVAPHATFSLNFSDERYFDGIGAPSKGRRIFVRIYIAGHRPLLRLVYPK